METELIPTKDLHPYQRNARTHTPEQIDQVAASITEFGWTNPVIIDGSNGIIAGHGRVMAAEKLGMESVPTIRLRDLSDEQKRAYILADNQLALNAGWDQDILKAELTDLADLGFDLTVIGFEGSELDDMLGDRDPDGTTDEDAVPEYEITPTTKPGDLWLMGDHVLLCGDSTKLDSVQRLMDGDQAQTVWTDPPYNVDYTGKTKDAMKIANDKMGGDRFVDFLTAAMTHAADHTDPGRALYMAYASEQVVAFREAAEMGGFEIKQQLIWVKSHFVLGRQDYQWQHEPIIYGWKPGKAHVWFGQYDKTTVLDDDSDIDELDREQLLDIIRELREQCTVLRVARPT